MTSKWLTALNSADFKRSSATLPMLWLAEEESSLRDFTQCQHLHLTGETQAINAQINALVLSLCAVRSPAMVNVYPLVTVESPFECYTELPHWRAIQAKARAKADGNPLAWVIDELESRLNVLRKHQMINITRYNQSRRPDEKMAFLLVVIPDITPHFSGSYRVQFENDLIYLARKAHLVGIHLLFGSNVRDEKMLPLSTRHNYPAQLCHLSTELRKSVEWHQLLSDIRYKYTDARFIDPLYFHVLDTVLATGDQSIIKIQYNFLLGFHHAVKLQEAMEKTHILSAPDKHMKRHFLPDMNGRLKLLVNP